MAAENDHTTEGCGGLEGVVQHMFAYPLATVAAGGLLLRPLHKALRCGSLMATHVQLFLRGTKERILSWATGIVAGK